MIQKSKKSMQRAPASRPSKVIVPRPSPFEDREMGSRYHNQIGRQKRLLSLAVRLAVYITGVAFVCGVSVGTWQWVYKDLSGSIATEIRVKSRAMQVSSQIRDIQGEEVGVFSDEARYIVPLQTIPKMVQEAFLAAEDSGFYSHYGVSLKAIVRAAAANIRREKFAQGASTITQQVVRQLLLPKEKTLGRKIREIVMALTLECQMSKSEILEIWLNSVYLGNNAWGVETAARHYFNKNIDQISLGEAALLAGLPQAPSRFAPHLRPASARIRQLYVLNQLNKLQWITKEQWAVAKRDVIRIIPPKSELVDQGRWVTEAVRLELWRRLEQKDLPKSGLIINTTIDRGWQLSLQKLVSKSFGKLRKHGLEMSVVVLDTHTGEIRSIVGGSDFSHSQFNRAIDLYRPIGSAIYPMIFGWAIEHGHLSVDRYNSIAEAAVDSRFNEAEQLAPALGYGLIRNKLMGLGFVVKDAAAIDEMSGSPLTIARAYLGIAGASSTAVHGLISSVISDGETIYVSSDRSAKEIKDSTSEATGSKVQGDPAVSWVVRKWMALGAKKDAPPLANQPMLKSHKGWNDWWIIPRNDVVIAAWIGSDGQEPKSVESLRGAERSMDSILAVWIKENLGSADGVGPAPAGVSYQMYQPGPGRPMVRIPIVVTEREVF
jgi:Transglycosylase